MLEAGICQPSSSSWASPYNIVKKKNGERRPFGDLNAITAPDQHIHDINQVFAGKTVFFTIDLVSAYHHTVRALRV